MSSAAWFAYAKRSPLPSSPNPQAPGHSSDSLRSFVRGLSVCHCDRSPGLPLFWLVARERTYALHNSIKLKCFAIPHRRNLLYNSQFFNCISGDKRRTRPNGTLAEEGGNLGTYIHISLIKEYFNIWRIGANLKNSQMEFTNKYDIGVT